MPHIHQMRTPKGDAAVKKCWGDDFERLVEQITAALFNEFWGETMQPGQQVTVYKALPTSSMPVDIGFSCMAWWTRERDGDLEEIEDEMTDAIYYLCSHLPGAEVPSVGVCIGFFGGPN